MFLENKHMGIWKLFNKATKMNCSSQSYLLFLLHMTVNICFLNPPVRGSGDYPDAEERRSGSKDGNEAC